MKRTRTDRDRSPRALLHICCGPCATHVIDLLCEDFEPICFYYNPNIHPRIEFVRRLVAAACVCRAADAALWIPPYLPRTWMHEVRGKEKEPEGGERCQECYRIRLEATALAAKAYGIEYFATTLTISPHKKSRDINRLGQAIASAHNLSFVAGDFKKQDGFRISVEKSQALGLYRQRYCGCCFSQKRA